MKSKERSEERRARERESERERERWFGEHLLHPTVWSFPFCLESGSAAVECHGDRLPGRFSSTEAKGLW